MPINYPGSDDWHFDIQIPADADPADGESVRVPMRQLADRTQFLLRNTIVPSDGETIEFHGSIFRPFRISGVGDLPLMGVGSGGGFRVLIDNEFTGLLLPLNRVLPRGARLLKVEVMMRPAVKSSPGTLQLWTTSVDFNELTVSNDLAGSASTNGTTDIQLLEIVPSVNVDIGFDGRVQYLSYSPNSITSGADIFEAVRLTFRDVPARNS